MPRRIGLLDYYVVECYTVTDPGRAITLQGAVKVMAYLSGISELDLYTGSDLDINKDVWTVYKTDDTIVGTITRHEVEEMDYGDS